MAKTEGDMKKSEMNHRPMAPMAPARPTPRSRSQVEKITQRNSSG